jgi:hypothetical protein
VVLSLQAWILVPALLLVVTLGWGLLIDAAADRRLPGALVVPLGLASVIVVSRAAMTLDATAELAFVVVAGGGVVGLWAGRRRLRPAEIDGWAAAAGTAAFVTLIAPIVLGGTPAFAGYSVLGDTAAHFVLADWIGTHGTDLGDLPTSSFRETLEGYLGAGYPLGGHAALEAVTQLALIDVAWALQPFLAFSIGCLALTLYGLLSGVVARGWVRAAVAAIAAQPALVYAYAMQGSIKEITTLWLVPLCVVLLVVVTGQRAVGPARSGAARSVVPLAIGCAAAAASIGPGAVVWLGPLLLAGLLRVAIEFRWGIERIVTSAAAFAGVLLVLSVPTLVDLQDYVNVTGQVVTTEAEFGNLFRPLRVAQVVGIWLSGDYRVPLARSAGIDAREATIALVLLAAAAAAVAVVWLLRRRALAPLLFAGVSLLAFAYITGQGSPWADAKALAITAPAVLLVVLLGPVALERWGFTIPALLLGLALAGGVLVSNTMIYRDVSLSPHDRFEELADIGDRLAGTGPTLYTEFEEFAKYFLRDGQPVGASEAFAVPGLSPLYTDGARPEFAREADLARLRPEDVDRFSALVLRRSPAGARPSLDYELSWRGRFYDVWTRRGGDGSQSAQVALGGHGSAADCHAIERLAADAGSQKGTIVGVPAPRVSEFATATADLPQTWRRRKDDRALVHADDPASVSGETGVPSAGRYEVWLRGSFGAEFTVELNGRPAGQVGHELSSPAGWVKLGSVLLEGGPNRVTLSREAAGLGPGSDAPSNLGSLILRHGERDPDLASVPASRWRRLCGRNLVSIRAIPTS